VLADEEPTIEDVEPGRTSVMIELSEIQRKEILSHLT
jgi:hypothetical protein